MNRREREAREWLGKFIEDNTHEDAVSPMEWAAPEDIAIDAFLAGARREAEGVTRFKLWGTDGCPRCHHGRVTLYYLSSQCVECENQEEGR